MVEMKHMRFFECLIGVGMIAYIVWINNAFALQNNIFHINVKIAIPPSLHSQALCVKCLIQNIILT